MSNQQPLLEVRMKLDDACAISLNTLDAMLAEIHARIRGLLLNGSVVNMQCGTVKLALQDQARVLEEAGTVKEAHALSIANLNKSQGAS